MPDSGLILAGARPIAAELGVRPGQVYYWSKAGLMPHFFVGRTLCAERAALRAWVAERQGRGPTASPATTERT